MQTHQVQPTPAQPRIATTHELMLPYAADLVRMRAKGASHGQMLSWLCGQGVYVNLAEIASFWSYQALQKQKPLQAPPPTTLSSQPSTRSTPPGQPTPTPGPGTGSKSTAPTTGPNAQNPRVSGADHRLASCEPAPPEWLAATGKNVQNLTAWFRDHSAPDLGILMHLYKSMLFNLLSKGDTSPGSFQQVQQMTRTVISYEQNKTRLELRRETLNRQKAEPEPKAGKPAKPPADQTADEQSAAVAANPTISDLSAILSAIVSRQNTTADGGSPSDGGNLPVTEEALAKTAQEPPPTVPPGKTSFTKPASPSMQGGARVSRALIGIHDVPNADDPPCTVPIIGSVNSAVKKTTAPGGTVPPIPSG